MPPERFYDDVDSLGGGEHTFLHTFELPILFFVISRLRTYLYCIASNIRQSSIDLFPDKYRWYDMNVIHTERVLSSQSCSGGHGIAAVSREGFLISLEAAVRARSVSWMR